MSRLSSCGHVRSLPADPEVCVTLASSDASAGDVPVQQTKRKRAHKTRTLVDVKAGICPFLSLHEEPVTAKLLPSLSPREVTDS